jgi:hypothetical protein
VKINGEPVESITQKKWYERLNTGTDVACFEKIDNQDCYRKSDVTICESSKKWQNADTAKTGGKQFMAMIEDYKDGTFGKTMKDWNKDKSNNNLKVVGRKSNGIPSHEDSAASNTYIIANFTPLTIDATDGDVIDFDNKARIKGTAIGAGSGAALGGLASFQGAKAEIEERYWVEQERYEGTLRGFYCSTGNYPLARSYNDAIIIPAMVKRQ